MESTRRISQHFRTQLGGVLVAAEVKSLPNLDLFLSRAEFLPSTSPPSSHLRISLHHLLLLLHIFSPFLFQLLTFKFFSWFYFFCHFFASSYPNLLLLLHLLLLSQSLSNFLNFQHFFAFTMSKICIQISTKHQIFVYM